MRRRPTLRLLGLSIALLGACASPAPTPFTRPFHVIGHRGAAGHAPENTLAGFRTAQALGVYEVELDVMLSRDDAVVLFHDAELATKTGLSGAVRDHDLSSLMAADLGPWFAETHPDVDAEFEATTIPTLVEVFEAFADGFHYHVELKSEEPALPAKVLELLSVYQLEEHATITSFHLDQLRRSRDLAPTVPTTWLLRTATPEGIDRAARIGFTGVGIRAREITPALVLHGRRQGLEVRAFGIKSDALMERALAAGAQGMTTDWPERLIQRVLKDALEPAP